MNKFSLIPITVLMALFTILTVTDVHADAVSLTIIHSSNLNGYVLPCPT
jgi:hypothetical protein